jgi:hypothetical protein
MRFATKFDRWLVILLIGAAVLTVPLPIWGFLTNPAATGSLWRAILVPLVWLVFLPCTLPQYYEVRSDCLFIRQGWRKIMLPYASLVALQPVTEYSSAPVFSTGRLVVTTRENTWFVIAPALQREFIEAVAARCPHLEHKDFGLALPFAGQAMM